MNATLKNIITSPITIGSAILGIGAVVGTLIYSKHRPKTDAEVDLEKTKEMNAQEMRIRESENKQKLSEIEKEEETKRKAKEEEEKTKRAQLDLDKVKEANAEAARIREWEGDRTSDYWHYKEAAVVADKQAIMAEKQLNTQKEIARMQADAYKIGAESNAKVSKEMAYMDLRRQESADRTEAAKWNVAANAISSVITGKVNT